MQEPSHRDDLRPTTPPAATASESFSVAEPPDRLWEDWMVAAQAGDGVAYARLMRAATPLLRCVARQRTPDEATAEAVVQDALRVVHAIRHTYDPSRPVRPWLTAIVERRVTERLRGKSWLLRVGAGWWSRRAKPGSASRDGREPDPDSPELAGLLLRGARWLLRQFGGRRR